MADERKKFLTKILEGDGAGEEARAFSAERQPSTQSFSLHVERRDGRSAEGVAWSHYSGHQWTDEGEHERLVVMFGERAVEIEGRNLGVLVNKIRNGQLNGVRELANSQLTLMEEQNDGNEPIISGVRFYPDFETMFNDVKGGKHHEDRHAE